MTDWQDKVVGARMTVDQEFSERVRGSSLSNSQWGLVMTAVEFDIENADDAEDARLVADTSKLEHVLPEMDKVDKQMGAMPGSGGSSGGSGGGVMSSIKNALGLGGGGGDDNEELAAEARQLAEEYARELQSHLEAENKWEDVRRTAAGD
ncbi:MAG: DUF5799 family protein [Halobacterium sp.]